MTTHHPLLYRGLLAAGVLAAAEGVLALLAWAGTRSHEELQARMAAGESAPDRHHPAHHHAAS